MYSFMLKSSHTQVWIRVPINQSKGGDPWHWWDNFRGNANTEKKLNLALVLDKEPLDEQKLKRWQGEPVKSLIISTR